MIKLLVLGAFLAAAPVSQPATAPATQPAPAKPVAAPAKPVEVSTVVSHIADTVAKAIPDPGTATVADVAKAAEEAIKTSKEYLAGKENTEKGAQKALALFGVIAVLLKLLLSLLKFTSPFWGTSKGGLVLRLVTVAIGVGAYFVGQLALGMSWWESLIVAFSGPGAVIFHEYSKLLPWFATKKEEKPADPKAGDAKPEEKKPDA